MLLKNKKILISGLANKYSIAAGIAAAMHREGAELAFTYQNERLLKNLIPIAAELGSKILIECDVSSDDSIKASFKDLKASPTLLFERNIFFTSLAFIPLPTFGLTK